MLCAVFSAIPTMLMGMATQQPVSVDDGSPITTSFPIFGPLMASLGAQIDRSGA